MPFDIITARNIQYWYKCSVSIHWLCHWYSLQGISGKVGRSICLKCLQQANGQNLHPKILQFWCRNCCSISNPYTP